MPESCMRRLARANPVPGRLSVAPFVPPVDQGGEEESVPVVLVRRPRKHTRRNGALALAGVACAVVVSILLAAGSSNSPVDVLAAVYAATAPRDGIVESVTVIRNNPGSKHQSTERWREWLQSSAARRRAAFTVSGAGASRDIVYSPRTWESWTDAAAAHDTIERIDWTGPPSAEHERSNYGGGFVGEQLAQQFHTLYLKRQFRVAGKVARNGRLLWKLEETPTHARQRAREDQTSYYALVDPHSFQPVYTRLIDLARPGRPTISEVELISLRTLPSTPSNEKLFDLGIQHPHANVVTRPLTAASTHR